MVDTSGTGETVLVIEDDPSIREIISFSLNMANYGVITANDGEEGLELVESKSPDLVLLDLMLPRMDGIEVCRRIKSGFLSSKIPVIMVTAKREVMDKLKGMDAGADDYITKPFNRTELLARIKMVLLRTRQQQQRNPLSGLPGNLAIENTARDLIVAQKSFALLYLDLDRFKGFNDHYGYSKGDDAIVYAAKILTEVTAELGAPNDFVGHIGGDDFVVICNTENVKQICEAIIRRYEKGSMELYDPEDVKRGYYVTKNRQKEAIKLPCYLGMTIAVVINEEGRYSNYLEMVDVAGELKKYGKTMEGSVYILDRRSGNR